MKRAWESTGSGDVGCRDPDFSILFMFWELFITTNVLILLLANLVVKTLTSNSFSYFQGAYVVRPGIRDWPRCSYEVVLQKR